MISQCEQNTVLRSEYLLRNGCTGNKCRLKKNISLKFIACFSWKEYIFRLFGFVRFIIQNKIFILLPCSTLSRNNSALLVRTMHYCNSFDVYVEVNLALYTEIFWMSKLVLSVAVLLVKYLTKYSENLYVYKFFGTTMNNNEQIEYLFNKNLRFSKFSKN